MDHQIVVKTWLFSGLKDIFFAFAKDDDAFLYQLLFSNIMGLEKIIKAVILYHRRVEYEGLNAKETRDKINSIAKSYGHNLNKMLKELSRIGIHRICQINSEQFDGFMGSDLTRVIDAGYMETRYPVPDQISDQFPIKNTNLTEDPLRSSCTTDYIYALCNICLEYLAQQMDIEELWGRFQNQYQHEEAFWRFDSLFWTYRCRRNK